MYKLTSKRPLNVLKSAVRKSRPLKPPISDIKAFNNSIKEIKKTPIKANKYYRKELDSSPVLAVATFLIIIIILFNNKKLFILSLVKKLDKLLFSLIAINKKERVEKYARLYG